jgi:hypothetical protein
VQFHVEGERRCAFASPFSLAVSKGTDMAGTKFAAGQRVALVGARTFSAGAPRGVYRIVTVLPKETGPQQYRVRSDGETHDRVIDEVRLEAVNYG